MVLVERFSLKARLDWSVCPISAICGAISTNKRPTLSSKGASWLAFILFLSSPFRLGPLDSNSSLICDSSSRMYYWFMIGNCLYLAWCLTDRTLWASSVRSKNTLFCRFRDASITSDFIEAVSTSPSDLLLLNDLLLTSSLSYLLLRSSSHLLLMLSPTAMFSLFGVSNSMPLVSSS